MSRVRVRLETTRARLSYDGAESLFEREIEPLLLAMARASRDPALPAQAPARDPAAAPEVADPEEAASNGYVPPSGSFSTFQRQLDPALDGAAERIPAYAFFLWNYEKKEVFREEEVRGCFHADDQEPPADDEPIYGELAEQRILEPAGEGSWRLTAKGQSHVRKSLR